MEQVPDILQNLYKSHYLDRPLEFIQILSLTGECSLQDLVIAIENLQKSYIPPEYVNIRMVLNNAPSPAVESLKEYDLINVLEPDLTVYDYVAKCVA